MVPPADERDVPLRFGAEPLAAAVGGATSSNANGVRSTFALEKVSSFLASRAGVRAGLDIAVEVGRDGRRWRRLGAVAVPVLGRGAEALNEQSAGDAGQS